MGEEINWYDNKKREEKKRVLKYVIAEINDKEKVFRVEIVEQSHRGQQFTPNGKRFHASNDAELVSVSFPITGSFKGKFFVRGTNTKEDNNLLVIPFEDFPAFAQAVREYNDLPVEKVEEINWYDKIRDGYIRELQAWIAEKNKRVANVMQSVCRAETLEEARTQKELLLQELIRIPKAEDYCPDCLVQRAKVGIDTHFGSTVLCEGCPFGQKQGICYQTSSRYAMMQKKYDELRNSIEELFDI